MTSVTVFTAERMQEIEDNCIVSGSIIDGHLILVKHNGETVDAGTVVVIGDTIQFAYDSQEYYRYTDAAGPFTPLGPGIYTPLDASIMDTDDGEPSWGHWDTGTDNKFVFDEAGMYYINSYATVDSSSDGTGHSVLSISDSISSGESEFDHVTGVDIRVENQLTALYQAGQSVRVDFKDSSGFDVTYAELYIKKLNIDVTPNPSVDPGSPIPISIMISDPNGAALSTGDGKAYYRIPSTLDGFRLSSVASHVTTASSSGNPTFQVHNVTNAVDMLTTKVSVDSGEKDSLTAATQPVIDEANDTVSTGDEIRIDCDVAGTGTKGAMIELQFS